MQRSAPASTPQSTCKSIRAGSDRLHQITWGRIKTWSMCLGRPCLDLWLQGPTLQITSYMPQAQALQDIDAPRLLWHRRTVHSSKKTGLELVLFLRSWISHCFARSCHSLHADAWMPRCCEFCGRVPSSTKTLFTSFSWLSFPYLSAPVVALRLPKRVMQPAA